jgi:Tfp pilus assembly protein PilZ
MSEFVNQAKQARETLARALGALQSDPSVPPSLLDVAEPVAMAMGSLHAIERSGQLTTASAARDHVRRALGMLQAQAALNYPAVASATESVASSLGLIFGLVKASEAAPAAPAASLAPTAVLQPAPVAPVAPVVPAAPAYAPPTAPAQAPPVAPAQAPLIAHVPPQPVQSAPVQPAPAPPPPAPVAAVSDPFALAPVVPAPPPARPSSTTPTRFEVALGINSPTNFYKGLSGNDVIEHGGLFVATYNKMPPVGSGVALRVMLPGGFEFESVGVVAWIRDSNSGESPGFGVKLTQLNAEAKQLVYRYVRNREPLFYDDL